MNISRYVSNPSPSTVLKMKIMQFLQMKVTRFEHLVQIKDMKIEELKKELETVKTNGRQTYLHHPVFHRR